jgi:hypothetical protein
MIPHLMLRIVWNRDVPQNNRGVHHHFYGQILEIDMVARGYFMKLIEEVETLCMVQYIGPAVQYQLVQLMYFTGVHRKAPAYHSIEALVGWGDKVSPLIFSPGCGHCGDPEYTVLVLSDR